MVEVRPGWEDNKQLPRVFTNSTTVPGVPTGHAAVAEDVVAAETNPLLLTGGKGEVEATRVHLVPGEVAMEEEPMGAALDAAMPTGQWTCQCTNHRT